MNKIAYERPFINKLNTGTLNKFGTRSEYSPFVQIDGVSIREINQKFGSPCFVISEKTIRSTFKNADRAFKTRYPKIQFAWSYKTNYLDAVCKIFHSEGSWAEVVSMFEYEKAIQNGVPGDKIIFNGPEKSETDLETAIKNSSLIHIDHFDELYTISEICTTKKLKAKVAIRVNMDTGIYPMWDRFGFNYENGQAWSAINKILSHEELELVGLHCHIGTYMLSTQAYSIAAHKLCTLAAAIKERYNFMIKYLDMGGGFASANTLKGAYLQGADVIPTMDEYAEAITTTVLNYGFKPNELPVIILETGRALIDDAGYLLGSVLALKRLSDGRRATIMDFGVNILFTSFWYNHKITPAQEFTSQTEDMVLYGPLCMNIDVVRESINLPLLKKGDQVVVHRVGAYNMTQWMQFIQMRPNVVLIDLKGNTHLIRKQENTETIKSQECCPEYLQNIQFQL